MDVRLGVVGAHLRVNRSTSSFLISGSFVQQTWTPPQYRLFVLPETPPAKPGMIRAEDGGSIEIEVWQLGASALGALIASAPPPLVIGSVQTRQRRMDHGISLRGNRPEGRTGNYEHGGWRAYLASI